MNERSISQHLSIPYPPIKIESKNMYYASLLTSDFAGTISEMSAVSLYTYQQIITSNKKFSAVIREISRTEMHHMEILGELICLLGGNPRIAVQSGCNSIFWSAQYISYETNPNVFLKENVTAEMSAIANYKSRINQISDPFIQKILNRIILDEENHIKLFNGLIKELN